MVDVVQRNYSDLVDLDSIPYLPHVVVDVLNEIDDINSSIGQIAELISQEVGLSTTVLKIANSTLYNVTSSEIVSIRKAVQIIGYNELQKICVAVGISNQFSNKIKFFDISDLWLHSLCTAYASGAILKYCHSSSSQNINSQLAYTAGLLHDIGMIVMITQQPELYEKVLDEYKLHENNICDIESKYFGFDHSQLSAEIIQHWNLPTKISEIVRYHHNHFAAPKENSDYTKLLHLSDSICNQNGYSDSIDFTVEPFDSNAWYDLKIDTEDIKKIIEDVDKKISEAKIFSSFNR